MTRLRKIPFKIWFFTFSVLFFVSSVLHLPGVGAETQDADYERYSREQRGLRDAVTLYHKDMNTLFNKKTEVLIAKTMENPADPAILPPPDGEACTDANVSAYCVALAAVDKYDAFRRALLITHRPYVIDESEEVIYQNFSEALDSQTARKNLVDEQIEIAEKAMDVTLATYNEIYLYYNLHAEYSNLITALEKYRDGLKNVRSEVEKYPAKFHNRTTTECT